jgi:hypothetical protein
MEHLEELLTSQEYARLRRCSVRTIERERTTGAGCQYIKLGRSVRYKLRDVLAFIEGNARHSTSEPAQIIAGETARQRAAKFVAVTAGDRTASRAATVNRRNRAGERRPPAVPDRQLTRRQGGSRGDSSQTLSRQADV